jgi:hypothetical protein
MSELMPRTALSPAEYWEWRTTISDMDLAKFRLAKTELEYKLLLKDSELMVARQQLFLKTRMDAARDGVTNAKAEYDRFKGDLEKSLGQSLSGKIIDDVTFEIKDLPDETTKPLANPAKEE